MKWQAAWALRHNVTQWLVSSGLLGENGCMHRLCGTIRCDN
jgi:hypothetical protein